MQSSSRKRDTFGAFPPRILEPAATQSLVFTSSDSGPFWMPEQEREET